MRIVDKVKRKKWMIQALAQASLAEKTSLTKGFLNKKQFYPTKKVQADITNLIYCMLCPNMCRFECPVVETSKIETHSPAIKSRIAYYLEMNLLDKSAETLQPLFEGCLHCSACKAWCPFDFAVGDLLEDVTVDLFQNLKKYPQKLQDFTIRIQTNNGLYQKEQLKKATKLLHALPKEGELYYFPGCVTMRNHPEVIEGIIQIAKKAGVKLVSLTDEHVCCGAPSLYLGDREKAKELAKHNKELFKKSKAKAILCECPECAYTLKEKYPELGSKVKLPVLHVVEWLWDLFEKEKLSFRFSNKKIEKILESGPIGYHDPCVLSRKLHIYDEAYNLLATIFQEQFKEITYSKEQTHCCGFGGLVNIANHQLADAIATKRLAEFQDEGIQTIITSCPTCLYGFQKNNPELTFELFDLVEIVSKLMDD